jgi:cob(I)alamin adenosyltransferase
MAKLEKGLITVYIGDGKGKTTAAMGVAVRAAGHGLKVSVIQLLKGGGFTGEMPALQKLGVEFRQFGPAGPSAEYTEKVRRGEAKVGREFFVYTKTELEAAKEALKLAERQISSGDYDVVILDEMNVALWFKHLTADEVLRVLRKKDPRTEVILTGREAPKEIIDAADVVTEMRKIKHPFDKGMPARWGIDY